MSKVRGFWRRLSGRRLADDRGGMAVLGAVLALPLAFLALGAVEFHRVTSVRSQLQAALDTATLAVALSPVTDATAQQTLGRGVLTNELGGAMAGATLSELTFADVNGDVTGKATLSIKPIIAQLVWQSQIDIRATSQIARLGKKLEVALILDNTYSMNGTRIEALRTAAVQFVDLLATSAAKTNVADALKVSVVPFSTTVKLPTTTSAGAARTAANSPWLDWNAQSPIHREIFNAPLNASLTPAANRMALFGVLGTSWGGCVETRPQPYDVQETAASTATPATLFVPYFAPDEPDASATLSWYENTYAVTPSYKINNYLPDGIVSTNFRLREKAVEKYHAGATRRTGAMGSGYEYGPNYNCTALTPIVPLTTDVGLNGRVRTTLANLTVAGDTNIPIGMIWGWHTLSPFSPFEDKGAAYSPDVTKIAVLMTDGDNSNVDYSNWSENQSLYSAIGFIWQNRLGIASGTDVQRRAAMDQRLSLICNNMKQAGTVIYTIRLEQTGAGTLLQGCASDPSKYYDIPPGQAGTLTSVFKSIADSILNIRVKS